MLTDEAAVVRKYLNGLICVYKSAGLTWPQLRDEFLFKLCSGLNSLKVRKPKDFVHINGDTTKELKMTIEPNYADHPLMVGPRFIEKEMKICLPKETGEKISGVCVLGLNDGRWRAHQLHEFNTLSTYHINCQFGILTDNKFGDGRITFTCNYNKLRRNRIDRSLSTIQSLHRRYLQGLSGYHSTTQEAYNIIASGNIRPAMKDVPVVYSLKCIEWDLPNFTIELVCCNENEEYLLNLIDEIGARSRNAATAMRIRRIRYSMFTVHDALLPKHWTLQNIIDNINKSSKKLDENSDFSGFLKTVRQTDDGLCIEHEEPILNENVIEESEKMF